MFFAGIFPARNMFASTFPAIRSFPGVCFIGSAGFSAEQKKYFGEIVPPPTT